MGEQVESAAVNEEVTEQTDMTKVGSYATLVLQENDGDVEELVRVFSPRRDTFLSLDGEGRNHVDRDKQICELSSQEATEVLFALAEAHDYELVAKDESE